MFIKKASGVALVTIKIEMIYEIRVYALLDLKRCSDKTNTHFCVFLSHAGWEMRMKTNEPKPSSD